MLLPFQGDIAILLDTQGDALGWQLLAFQADVNTQPIFPSNLQFAYITMLYRHLSLKVVNMRRFSLHIYCIFQTNFVNLHRISEEWICPQPGRGGALDMLNLIP